MDAGSKQKIIKAVGLLGAGAVIGSLCTLLYCGSSRSTSTDSASTDGDLGRITEQQRQLSVEISASRDANRDAEEAVHRATASVGRCETAAAEISGGIDGLEQQIRECRRLAERNEELFEEIERFNRSGTGAEQGSTKAH